MLVPKIILQATLNKILAQTEMGKNLGIVTLVSDPSPENDFLIREKKNIQGICHPTERPHELYNFVIHVDDNCDAESIVLTRSQATL